MTPSPGTGIMPIAPVLFRHGDELPRLLWPGLAIAAWLVPPALLLAIAIVAVAMLQ